MHSIESKRVNQIEMIANIVKNYTLVYLNILIGVMYEIMDKRTFFQILSIN